MKSPMNKYSTLLLLDIVHSDIRMFPLCSLVPLPIFRHYQHQLKYVRLRRDSFVWMEQWVHLSQFDYYVDCICSCIFFIHIWIFSTCRVVHAQWFKRSVPNNVPNDGMRVSFDCKSEDITKGERNYEVQKMMFKIWAKNNAI